MAATRQFKLSLVGFLGIALVAVAPLRAGESQHHDLSWALTPIVAPQVPAGLPPNPSSPNPSSPEPIDLFIRADLARHNLAPAPPAERLTLLRRAYFDLIGLGPPPHEVERFAKDVSPDAYARLIDRLLASSQYGERWGRHWLDVARYGDTGGFEHDLMYEGAWKYRDYVIRSFNANKPIDRFFAEQIAGDELWPADSEAVEATAIYCVGPALTESSMTAGQLEYEWLTDAADTTGAAFLGVTFGCARCHDHKYDPIKQVDHFAMQAIFAASDRAFPQRVRDNSIKGLNGLLSDTPIPAELQDDPRCTVKTEKMTGHLHLFHRERACEVRRLQRGELSKPKEMVQPALPAQLCGAEAADLASVPPGQRRAALARWITSPKNPLTARVFVNRVWAWHFGSGIVRTPSDFGGQGEPPTHPQLLDWLARDFIDHGWDLKRLHRQIMLSATYRMQSVASDRRGMEIDPEDRLLWHFPRQRLDGEAIRDAMLDCAGTLNLAQFGPPVVPPLGPTELTGLFDAKNKWQVTQDPSQHARRSVYVLVRRTFLYPMFAAFDPPEVMSSCPRRMRTVVPTQALTLLNSPLAREQAAAFAARLSRECPEDLDRALARAWVLAFGREITPEEAKRAREFVRERPPCDAALAELCLALFNANEFVYVD